MYNFILKRPLPVIKTILLEMFHFHFKRRENLCKPWRFFPSLDQEASSAAQKSENRRVQETTAAVSTALELRGSVGVCRARELQGNASED